jgi:hypothetical protein
MKAGTKTLARDLKRLCKNQNGQSRKIKLLSQATAGLALSLRSVFLNLSAT